MRNALHEQLLKAGLIDEARLRNLERDQQRQRSGAADPKRKKPHQSHAARSHAIPELETPAPQAPPKTNAATQAQRRAAERELVQLIKNGRIPHNDGDEVYNFVDGRKIGRIYVTAATQAGIINGEYAVVRLRTRYAVVMAATAALITQRAPDLVVAKQTAEGTEQADRDYRDFPVPDDLRW
ncbi:MAG: DUF2058 family protein [Gammaproteobacteria bacterium]